MAVIASVWTPFGLRQDPYFQEPLQPTPESQYPTGRLFVGRDEDLRLIGSQVLGSPSSRAVIEGDRGAGKTTLIAKLKADLAAQGVLTHERPVRVTADATPESFMVDVLRALLGIHTTLRNQPNTPSESDSDVKFWRRIQHLVEGEDVTNVGGGIATVSVSTSRTRIAAERPTGALYDEIEHAFEHLGRRAPRRDGNGGVLVHVNNLENLTRDERQHARALMTDIRDIFMTRFSHWVFVGATGIGATVFGDEAVRTLIPLHRHLDPLSGDELLELLNRRYDYLKIARRWIAPVTDDAAASMYNRYNGNLRGFLRLLSMAVQRFPFPADVRGLSANEVVQTVASEYRRELVRQVGEADAQHLAATVALVQTPLFRNTEVVKATGLKAPSAKTFIERLEKAGVLVFDQTMGRSTYYKLSGDAQTALAM